MKPDNFSVIAVAGLTIFVAAVIALLPSVPNPSDRLTIGLIVAEIVGFGGLISVEVFTFL